MWPVYIVVLQTVSALRMDECEPTALGMESGAITDAQIISSTSFDRQSVGPQNSRIRTEMASGAWCPKPQIHSGSYEFLQINLDNTYIITAVETQGRYGNGTGREFVAQYMIDYLRPGSKWIRYTNRTGHTIMTGNSDTTSPVMRELNPPLFASKIRIVPYSKQTRTICLRAELHGCVHKDGLLYYSTIPGGSRVGKADFRDLTFENSDLFTEAGIRRGLGLLSDGYIAESSPFDESNPNGSWIGWSRHHSEGMVTLLFDFDQLRNFSEIVLVAYGQLSNIDVIFSTDGTNFSLSSQISSLSRSPANSTSKRNNYRIPLHKRMAKKIRVTIWFANDWIFLTEVHFSSVYFNDSVATITQRDEPIITRNSAYAAVGLLALLVLLVIASCIVLLRRRKPEDKFNVFEEDIRKSLIITQIKGKTATELLSSRHPPPNITPNFYSTTKTTSTSLSSKSASPKFGTATWNDFHFPPPPSASNEKNYDGNVHHYASTLVREQAEKVLKIPSTSLLIGAELGNGKHTVVRECHVSTLGNVAYKTAKDRNSFHARNALIDELKTLTLTTNPHIVRLLATDDSGGLLLELVAKGNVKQYLQSQSVVTPITQLLGFCADVCEGMRYLESLGLVHGHLSPTNILLDENLRAKVASPRGPFHHAQLRYSAPESILKNSFSSSSDVWAFAACCWEIVETSCTRTPFETLLNTEVVENAQRLLSGYDDAVALEFTEAVPRGVRNVFVRCFEVDPQARPSFAHISYFMSKYYVVP